MASYPTERFLERERSLRGGMSTPAANDLEQGTSEAHPLLAPVPDPTPPDADVGTADALSSIKTIIFSSYINLLLGFLPFAIVSGVLDWSPNIVFITNFFAIMPLAWLMSFSTEELSRRVGQGIGSLLNVTFGNATELIVGIVALKEGQVKLIQSAMLGSILSSLLFVLGLSFVVGGTQQTEFTFSSMIAQTMSSFMFVATGALIIPAAFDMALPDDAGARAGVLGLSHGASVVLLIIYIMFLVYQLKTHAHVFEEEGLYGHGPLPNIPVGPPIPYWVTITMLLLSTVAVSFCSDFLVGSIDGAVVGFGVSKTFVALVLVPMVGNAAEAVTCLTLGYKMQMDLVVAITLGSCMQIALFLIPLLVVMGWIIDVPMSLNFDIFQAVVIFISVVFTEYLIIDGSSNWMEGSMLIGVYTIVAIAYWLYPDLKT